MKRFLKPWVLNIVKHDFYSALDQHINRSHPFHCLIIGHYVYFYGYSNYFPVISIKLKGQRPVLYVSANHKLFSIDLFNTTAMSCTLCNGIVIFYSFTVE